MSGAARDMTMSTTEPTEDTVRAEVRTWLKANWNPDLGLVEWRNKLCEFGLGRAALAQGNGTAATCR